MTTPQPKIPDAFDLLHRLEKKNRVITVFGVTGMLMGAFGMFTVFTVAMSPTPVVIWPDNPDVPPKLVNAGDVSVREIDAKRFFKVVADKLLAWSSADVTGHFDEARLLMNSEWRSVFNESLTKTVDVPKEVVATGKTTALDWMVRSTVRNEIDPIKLENITCTKTGPVWNCKATVKTRTMPMLAPPSPENTVERKVVIQAGFKEYPVTNTALYGLLVSYWEVLDKTDD
jgi:hypothetical protein